MVRPAITTALNLTFQVKRLAHARSFSIALLLTLITMFKINMVGAEPTVAQQNKNQQPVLTIAVATNFLPVLEKLIPRFEQQYQIKTQLVSAASGVLFQQIIHGAPFDVFLSADSEKPRLLEQQGLTVANSRYTYATGQLAWYSSAGRNQQSACQYSNPQQQLNCYLHEIIRNNDKLAIANPKIAPYGLAAKQLLDNLSLWQPVSAHLIRGSNIGQSFLQVRSQSVNYGIVAYSQLLLNNLPGLLIPTELYQPIKQQLVILKKQPDTTQQTPAQARTLVKFLLAAKTQVLIAQMGYQAITTPPQIDSPQVQANDAY